MQDDAIKRGLKSETLDEPILLGDCPIVVRNAADAKRAAQWVEDEFWKKVEYQPAVRRAAGGE